MAWGQPKRNTKNLCGHRGQCSCQRRINAEVANNPDKAPKICTIACKPNGFSCGRVARGGVCPCPNC